MPADDLAKFIFGSKTKIAQTRRAVRRT